MNQSYPALLDEAFHQFLNISIKGNDAQLDPHKLHYLINYLFHKNIIENHEHENTIKKILFLFVNSKQYDHIGGGFFNTSSLKKTLINNSNIIRLLTNASGHFFEGFFSIPAINSCQWLITSLQTSSGYFKQYFEAENSLNNYYALDLKTIKSTLDNDSFTAFASTYDLHQIEAESINQFSQVHSFQQVADKTTMHIKQVPLALDSARQQLLIARSNKAPPSVNDTFNCTANNAMISTLLISAKQFNRDDFSRSAITALNDIQQNYWPNNVTATSDYLSLINCLLKRLQFEWSQQDYEWLLECSYQFLNLSVTNTSTIVQVMIEHNIDSVIDDFNNLFLLSSDDIFKNISKEIYTEIKSRLATDNFLHPSPLTALLKNDSSQFFIVIRGSNYESINWQQLLTTGFKPCNHIYAIASKHKGPDQLKFPIRENNYAAVYSLNPSHSLEVKAYDSINELLDLYS